MADQVKELQDLVRRAALHIEWLLPFLDVKARESGDVAGLQANAADMVKEIRGVLTLHEAEARVAAANLAKGITWDNYPVERPIKLP